MIPKMLKPEKEEETGPKVWPDSAAYAGFYARSLAFFIDSFALLVPLLVLALVLTVVLGPPPQPDPALQQITDPALAMQELIGFFLQPEVMNRLLVDNILSLLVAGGCFIAFWHYYSATPGKMLLGMKIVDAESGQPPTRKQDIIRFLGYFLSCAVVFLGFVNIAWDRRKQGWHDKLSNTVVVYKKSLPENLAKATRHGQLEAAATTGGNHGA